MPKIIICPNQLSSFRNLLHVLALRCDDDVMLWGWGRGSLAMNVDEGWNGTTKNLEHKPDAETSSMCFYGTVCDAFSDSSSVGAVKTAQSRRVTRLVRDLQNGERDRLKRRCMS